MEAHERDHIKKHLPALIEMTMCNYSLLARLVSKGMLTNDELAELDTIRIPFHKSSRFYKCLLRRHGAYEALITSLLETNQSGAVAILRQLDSITPNSGPSRPNKYVSEEEDEIEPQMLIVQSEFTSKPLGLEEFLTSPQKLLILCTLDSSITSQKIEDTTNLNVLEVDFSLNASKELLLEEINFKRSVCLKLLNTKVQNLIIYLKAKRISERTKFIVVTEENIEDIVLVNFGSSTGIKVLLDEFQWSDLKPQFQKELLERDISDQGQIKTLKNFCEPIVYENVDEYLSRFLKGEVLLGLIKNTLPVIYRQTVPPVTFYVWRKIYHRSTLELAKLFPQGYQHPPDQVFVFSGFEKKYKLGGAIRRDFESSRKLLRQEQEEFTSQFIRLKDENHFQPLCSKIHPSKNVHWLMKKDETNMIWKKSRGSISSIIDSAQKSSEPTFETDFLKNLERRRDETFSSPFICICDTPGMGKSVLLANLAKRLMTNHPDRVVLFIIFSEFINIIQQLQRKADDGTVDRSTILEALSSIVSSTEFGKKLFKENSNKKIELMFDGLDEVHQEQIQVAINFLKLIPSTMKNSRIFITARPHFLHHLERELNTLGYTIKPFDSDDQETFLIDFWSQDRIVNRLHVNKEGLLVFAQACLSKLRSALKTGDWEIAGIPLQCLLIAEVFREQGNAYADPKNDKKTVQRASKNVSIKSITDLYEHLVDKKLDAYEQRYLKSKFRKVDKLCAIKIHGYLSFTFMFSEWKPILKKELLTPTIYEKLIPMCPDSDIDDVSLKKFHEGTLPRSDILRMGFMESFELGGKFHFIHRTFAEFFAAKNSLQILKQQNAKNLKEFVQKAVLETTSTECLLSNSLKLNVNLHSFKHPVICYFLNALMKTELNVDVQPQIMTPTILSACTHDNLMQMFICLHGARGLNELWVDDQLLLTAVQKSSLEFLRLILSQCKPDKCVKNLMYIAVERGDFYIVNLLHGLEQTQKIWQTEPNLPYQLMKACLSNTQNGDQPTIKNKIEIINLLKNLIKPADWNSDSHSHLLLCSSVHIQLLLELIKSCDDITFADKLRKTLLHICPEYLSPSDYHLLLSKLDEKSLPTLLKCRDIYMMTPLHHLVWYLEPLEETINIFRTNLADTDFNAEDDSGNNVLWHAINSNRSKNCLELLTKYGADVNKIDQFGRSALHIATINGNLNLIKWLVEDAKLELDAKDDDGNTPTFYSLYNENETSYQVIYYLLQKGANIHEVNEEKQSLLHFAARHGHSKSFQFLLQQGLNLDAKDRRLNTVLHHTLRGIITENGESILKQLPLSGLMALKNEWGETALSSHLKQDHVTVNINVLKYLAFHVSEWNQEEISLALKYLEIRKQGLEKEIYCRLKEKICSKVR